MVLVLALLVLVAAVVHLATVHVPETRVLSTGEDATVVGGVDLRGTWRLVRTVPGLVPLIAFSCFNNFIAGGFMALMDAYGLSWCPCRCGGCCGGLERVDGRRRGCSSRASAGQPAVRVLLLVNVAAWGVTFAFPFVSSVVTLTVAMAVFMLLMPFAEAAEQTVLQRVVPYERQAGCSVSPERRAGRVARDGVPRRPAHALRSSSCRS